MCLLKRDNKDTNCGHEECRNYYLMNRQLCVHNQNQAQMQNNLLSNPSLLLQNQVQQRAFTPGTMPFNMDMQQILNNKRPVMASEGLNSDDSGVGMLNKKKFKSNDENQSSEYQSNQKPANENPVGLSDLGVSAHQLGGVFGKAPMLNSQLLNNFLLANNQQNLMKPEAQLQQMQQFPQFNDMMGGLFQSSQMGTGLEHLNNAQQAFNMNSFMAQQLLKSAQISNGSEGTPLESRVKTEMDADCEAFLKEFQTRTMGMLFNQNTMLVDLKEKNDVVQDTLACLIGEVNTLKKLIDQPTIEKPSSNSNPLMIHQILGNSSETGSMEGLLTYLYGPKLDFNYYLVLKQEFPLPLYRERNFKFTVMLVDGSGKVVENSNRIPLTISIYSSENPPKYIDANTAGNKILKGFTEKDLINGTASFDKIQIKEVTSHFRNGWVFFVVHPKVIKNPNNNILMNSNGMVVDSQKIKPLVLEKVIVKAKKTKEKEQNLEGSPNSEKNDSPKEDIYE